MAKTPAKDREIGAIDLALSQATLYNALALGFRPPTEETIARLAFPKSLSVLMAAANLIDQSSQSNLAAPIKDFFRADIPSISGLMESYWRLFGHTARGVVSPYETEYGSEALFQQPQELGDLMGFYHAFGLAPVKGIHERPDHISYECEFLSFLKLKVAYALEQSDHCLLEDTRKAWRLFLRDHLGRYAPAFAKNLAREDKLGFYASLGDLCHRLVVYECSQARISVGPDNLTIRPATDDRVPLACGSGNECMAMPGTAALEEVEEE